MIICIYQINKWTFQWKMSFNPDPSKRAPKFFLTEKLRRFLIFHYVLITALSWKPIPKIPLQISWCLINILGTFESNYYQGKQSYRTFAKIAKTLLRLVLITMCKALVRPHLNYGDMIYDEAYNEIFHWKLRSIQYNACLALSGAITGLSREKLYHKLGLESFQRWHWYKKLCLFYKTFKENKHVYLFNLIPIKKLDYNTRNINKITLLHTKNNFFKHCFFHPLLLNETS